MSYRRIMAIGIDGGTWQIFDHMIEKGVMPCLARLKEEGRSGILKSTDPPLTPPGWASFMTGVNPDKHKVLDFEEFSFRTGKIQPTGYHSIAVETMWKYLSDRGHTVISLNMPVTYPPPEVKGAVVSGFGCPGMNCNFTWPAALKNDIIKHIPKYDLTLFWNGSESMSTLSELKESVRQVKLRHKNELELTNLVMSKYPDWRLMAIQIHTFDSFMHRGLQYATADYLSSHPEVAKEIYDLFSDMDNLFARLTEYCDSEQDLIIVASDHGHTLLGDYIIEPNILLKQWGYLSCGQTAGRVMYKLKKNMNKILKSASSSNNIADQMKLDLKHTRAFSTYSHHQASVCFNMKSRWKHGIVADTEYNALYAEIKNKFLNLRHPETGEQLIEKVMSPQELYGPQAANDGSLGDLIVIPAKNYFFRNHVKGDKWLVPGNPEKLKGFHHSDGMYLFNGRGVKSQTTADARIADMTPTIYAALGLAIPEGLDGKVLSDAFEDKLKITFSGSVSEVETGSYILSQQEQKSLERHLENMGYM
ncbi:MAG: alkaline phosphatase family protein [Sedimentisphaerales bacterium]|nr:alkaline phosphatase family protein [Sedimentisphaerales bacterium]MBN2842188.1 alkaline phosphatase family protein [Sedimentisphaerales bacterium]